MIIGRDIDRTLEIIDEPVLDGVRYWDMVAALPQGDFYSMAGIIIPKRAGSYRLRFIAPNIPLRNFNVMINGVLTRTILTDALGEVEFSDSLLTGPGSGMTTIRIEDSVETGRALLSYLTITNYALMDAAEAAVTENVDLDIRGVKGDSFLDTVSVDDIESKFGIRILTQRTAVWSIDVYREILEELYQAYDIFSGTDRGLHQVVGAITQVPPTVYRRDLFGPRWVLGFQYLRNNEFAFDSDSDSIPDDWYIDVGSATMLIDTAGAGLINLFADQRLEVTATGVGNAGVISEALPIFNQYLGFEFTFSAWVESVVPGFSIVVGMSDDGGATWTETVVPIVTINSPQFVQVKKVISTGATSLLARVRQAGSVLGDVWYIERTSLFVRSIIALYLGDGTIPRSMRKSSISRPLLWWSPDVLVEEEMTLDGLSDFIKMVQGQLRPTGHINNIVPAHVGVIDRDITLRSVTAITISGIKISYLYPGMATGAANIDWDTATNRLRWAEPGEVGWGAAVTVTQSGLYVLKSVSGRDSVVVAVNFTALDPAPSASQAITVESTVKGIIYLSDWNSGLSRINLDVVSRSPDRFSYVCPPAIYDVLTASLPVLVTGVTINSVSNNTLIGVATLVFDFAATSLSWEAPGDTAGVPVVVAGGGVYDIVSGNGINLIRATVVAGLLPGVNRTDLITISGGQQVGGLVSEYTERLSFDALTNNASLSYQSTQNQLTALLLENGLALPADQWSFVGPATVNIVILDPSAVYQFTYEVLMEYESGVIDLGVNFASYAWVFDSYCYERYEKDVAEYSQTLELVFSTSTLLASLRYFSNQDRETSQLIQTLGGLTTIVSDTQWSYVDSRTIQISGAQFNANATYSFTYLSERMVRDPVPRLEFRVASSAVGVIFSPYVLKNRGDFFDSSKRYHKIKVNIYDVLDVRDVRVRSLVLKGLKIVMDGPGL